MRLKPVKLIAAFGAQSHIKLISMLIADTVLESAICFRYIHGIKKVQYVSDIFMVLIEKNKKKYYIIEQVSLK